MSLVGNQNFDQKKPYITRRHACPGMEDANKSKLLIEQCLNFNTIMKYLEWVFLRCFWQIRPPYILLTPGCRQYILEEIFQKLSLSSEAHQFALFHYAFRFVKRWARSHLDFGQLEDSYRKNTKRSIQHIQCAQYHIWISERSLVFWKVSH